MRLCPVLALSLVLLDPHFAVSQNTGGGSPAENRIRLEENERTREKGGNGESSSRFTSQSTFVRNSYIDSKRTFSEEKQKAEILIG
jgi:hypothetical protein